MEKPGRYYLDHSDAALIGDFAERADIVELIKAVERTGLRNKHRRVVLRHHPKNSDLNCENSVSS